MPLWLVSFFRPPSPARISASDPRKIEEGYRHWQPRILIASTVGYAVFYFVRKNLPVAMPALADDLHFSNAKLGLFLTLHGVIYGISKFINGFFGDRANAPTFMATGLILSALANVVFGSTSLAMVMGVAWMVNGYFQGMGFPPCARLLTHWFPPKQLATKMSIWNSSHSVGAVLIVLLCGCLVHFYGWRYCFFVPAAIAFFTAIYLLVFLRDTPESLGLPPVEHLDDMDARDRAVEPEPPYSDSLRKHVFSNPYIWLFSLANFFVYIIRYGVFDWAPTFLSKARGIRLTHSIWILAAYEGAGVVGALTAGWMTDRFFGGRAARASVFYMIGCSLMLYLFWRIPAQSELTAGILMASIGFLIYGPQCLIGVGAANLATKRAAAAAVGLTGLFGYASTVLSGWGLGLLVDRYGWDRAFEAICAVGIIAIAIFIACWPAKAHGYEDETAQGFEVVKIH